MDEVGMQIPYDSMTPLQAALGVRQADVPLDKVMIVPRSEGETTMWSSTVVETRS
ncbi:hypothetical protein KSP39_PZI004614 [Platanthera zijinensis]|uniref:Uncharacterized protein n=1 Tax=Platanthera zijinensis TaxID=2320716 RepID=A0AAP0GCU1_9ASPA